MEFFGFNSKASLCLSLMAVVLATGMMVLPKARREPVQKVLVTPATSPDITLISHAAAGLAAGDYSNSREALDRAYHDNLRLIEVDFSWTSDGQIVLLHDWDREIDVWFDVPLSYKIYRKVRKSRPDLSHEDFLNLRMRHDLTQLDVKGLTDWLERHPEVRIVTDFKADNLRGLEYIARTTKDAGARFIPQIYDMSEYASVQALGYDDIVFTAYRSEAPDEDIVEFAERHDLFAVTVPQSRLTQAGLPLFAAMPTPLWTHTVNDPLVAIWLHKLGVDGLYTDNLVHRTGH